MASPGQRRGNCGHIMAAFDGHKKCARYRDKKLGDDPCVKNQLCTICSVLKILFLVGPGRYGFQRAGTRVLAPMGDNRRFYKNLHIYKLKTYTNNRIQPFALYLVGHVFCIQNSKTQKKC